jgi:hypothetical protein
MKSLSVLSVSGVTMIALLAAAESVNAFETARMRNL